MLNIELPNVAIPLLSIYPQEMKTQVHIKRNSWMFITALFIMANKCKQHKCPATD